MNLMKSFGLWYKQKEQCTLIPKFDLHINFWNVPQKNNADGSMDEIPLVDFGIKISEFHDTTEIAFSIPCAIDDSELIDLSHVLKSDEVQLIFNDITYKYGEMASPYNGISNSKEKIIILPLKKGVNDTFVSQVSAQKSDDNQKYTIKISLNKYGDVFKDVTSVYFRFRIKSRVVSNTLMSKLEEKNFYLESAFEERQIIDIKFNNARNIDKYDIRQYKEQKFNVAKLNSVHLFIMVPSFFEVTIWDNFSECRLLESDVWDNYLQNEISTNDVIAYHWKKKSSANGNALDDFTQLIKIANRTRNWKIILTYCAIVVFLGSLGSGLFYLVQKVFGL